MITANFKAYASYVTDSLHQWDLNQVLQVSGLGLSVVPEVHFSNANVDRAIVRQATMSGGTVAVGVPNSLLQDPLRIYAHIGIYEGDTFKVVELVEIPVTPRKRPADYQIQDSDEEIYSFKALENAIANMATRADAATISARIDTIVANANSTDGNSELVDIRVGADGTNYTSAGAAVRGQTRLLGADHKHIGETGRITFAQYAGWVVGGMMYAQPTAHKNRIMSGNILHFDRIIKIKISEGFKIGVHTVTADGTFVADSNWQQSEYSVPAGTYFKMVVARVQEDSAETADIAEFSAAVSFDAYTLQELDKVAGVVDSHADMLKMMAGKRTFDAVGSYYTTGGSGAANNRIHASDIVCDGLISITFNNPGHEYFYGVDLYTNDGRRAQISTSGWMHTKDRPVFIVSQDCVIDLLISKIDATSFTSLTEMDGLFTISVYDTFEKVRSDMGTPGGRKKNWITSAHQGFVDNYTRPNTLAAYYNAYLNGADMIETDAWLSSDGVLIVNHDPTVTGTDASGQQVTYTIAETPASALRAVTLSESEKWGTQYVPTLEQVLHLAYHTGLQVNIDLKNGYQTAEAVAKLVLKHGMQGRVVYALNGSGMTGINTIMAIDPDARFIDSAPYFVPAMAEFAERGKRCFAYTSDASEETVAAIREGGCMVALISLNAANFEAAISLHPDMCEYLHTSNFGQIEADYAENLKLY